MAKLHQWKYDGDYTDSVGALTGTPGGSLSFVPGIFGQGIESDDLNGYVNYGNPADLQFTTGPFVFSHWMYFDGSTPPAATWVYSRWEGGSYCYALRFFSGKTIGFYANSIFVLNSPFVLSKGLYHIAVRRGGEAGTDPAQYDMFINGALVVSNAAGPAAIPAGSTNFRLFNPNGISGVAYDYGWIDNLEVWNEAKTDAAILAMYNDPLIVYAPYFDFAAADMSPDDLDTGVGTTQKLGIVFEDDTQAIPLADIDLRLTRGDGEEQVYLSSAYVAPYTGDAPIANASGRGWILANVYPTGGWFEDLDIFVRGVIGSDMDEDYTFEVETLGFIRNGSGEAPGATAELPKAWDFTGDVIRSKNPTNWPAPPEGDHVFLLFDDVDLTFPANSDSVSIRTQTLDLTDVVFIQFWERADYPTIDAGDTVTHRVYLDNELIYEHELTDADSGIDETVFRRVFGFAAYTGVHTLKAVATFHKNGEQVWVEELKVSGDFDGGTLEHESFALWSGFVQAWVESDKVSGLFDGDTIAYDDFDLWSGLFQFWTEGSAVKGTFDDDTTDHEDFDAWAT